MRDVPDGSKQPFVSLARGTAHFDQHAWRDEKRAIEARMVAELDDDDPWVGAACTSLIGVGGKRLRASLLVHCARAAGANPGLARAPEGALRPARALDGAAAVELLHLGTLVHDDIADRAVSRRGVIAVHEQWGNWTAALVGARMFIHSTTMLVELAPALRGRLVDLVVELCTGQMRDLLGSASRSGGPDEPLRAYLHLAQRKTASLFSFACELGAALGAASEPKQRLAARWGTRFGILYQIIDDMLDLFGDERLLGKPPGSDLSEGRRSFPWVITNLDPSEYRARMLTDPSGALADARRSVISAGGLAAARSFACLLGSEAKLVRNSFEGDVASALSEATVELMERFWQACETAEALPHTSSLSEAVASTLQTTLSELDDRPVIAPGYGHEQLRTFLALRGPELSMSDCWRSYQTPAVALAARAAADTARAFGAACDDLSEAGRWCALAVELLAGLQDRSYAADSTVLLAGDAALVHALGHVLALDPASISELLRGVEQTIRRTLRMASPGVPFGGPPIQPMGAQLQPLAGAMARIAARRAGASWTASRAVAEHWMLLMQLAADGARSELPTQALLSDMHERIGSMALSEPAVLLASLSSVAAWTSPLTRGEQNTNA
jgi:heptaprenyl diphosphate synthase